ncbi:hypothetical protein V2J09_002843 [Rumex salicifolius]
MLHLLFAVIFLESAGILLLLFKTPARKFLIAGIDRFKRGRGPIVVKTVAGTVLTVLSSSLYSIFKTRKRWIYDGDANPTDQVLMSNHILEASLLDRVHHYIRELRLTRKTVDAAERNHEKFGGPEDIKAREEQVGFFKDIVRQLQSELEIKANEVDAAEAKTEAFRKQSEGLLLEYDRLLAENQELRAQLESLHHRFLVLLSTVNSVKPRNIITESPERMIISPGASRPFTSRAYSEEARARKATLDMLGTAKNKKKTGRSIAGRRFPPDKC